MAEYEPKIIAFVCNWCTYAGADLAGTSRMRYMPNVRIVRLPCSGRISVLLILKAFEMGADGVLVSGCHPGDCHYVSGNLQARRRFAIFRKLMEFSGLDLNRMRFSWISAAEGGKWVKVIDDFINDLKKLGPYEQYRKMLAQS
jgi:coenzyme F420-reducing hydrogenase delta subunit